MSATMVTASGMLRYNSMGSTLWVSSHYAIESETRVLLNCSHSILSYLYITLEPLTLRIRNASAAEYPMNCSICEVLISHCECWKDEQNLMIDLQSGRCLELLCNTLMSILARIAYLDQIIMLSRS